MLTLLESIKPEEWKNPQQWEPNDIMSLLFPSTFIDNFTNEFVNEINRFTYKNRVGLSPTEDFKELLKVFIFDVVKNNKTLFADPCLFAMIIVLRKICKNNYCGCCYETNKGWDTCPDVEMKDGYPFSNIPYVFFFRSVKKIVENYQKQYNEWERYYNSYISTLRYMVMLLLRSENCSNYCSEEQNKLILTACFLIYKSIYSNSWESILFGEEMEYVCSNLKSIRDLEKKISGDIMMCYWFHSQYTQYCKQHNTKPRIIVSPLSPKKDDDPQHLDYFEIIPDSKFKGTDDVIRMVTITDLYSKLIENGYIDTNTDKGLFIYRLSGFLPYFTLQKGNEIIWKKDKTHLAVFLNLLYRTEQEKPHFKKISTFFSPNIPNASQLVKMANNSTEQEIEELLKGSDFCI